MIIIFLLTARATWFQRPYGRTPALPEKVSIEPCTGAQNKLLRLPGVFRCCATDRGLPVISLGSWSCSVYICSGVVSLARSVLCVVFCVLSATSSKEKHGTFFFACFPFSFELLFCSFGILSFISCVCCACRIQYNAMALHCLLCLLHNNVVYLRRSLVTRELSLY